MTEEEQWKLYREENFPGIFIGKEQVCIVDSNFKITSQVDLVYGDDGDLTDETREFITSSGFTIEQIDFFEELSDVELCTFTEFYIDVQLGDIECSEEGSDEYKSLKKNLLERNSNSFKNLN